MNIEQHAAMQPAIVEIQRMALLFSELGQSKVSFLLMQAGIAAARIKPTKSVEVAPVEAAPEAAKKGKGA